MAFELEPGLDPQAPMPDLEKQLGTEAEALEGAAERMAAVPISDDAFKQLEPGLVPDDLHEWYANFAAAGPVPATPADD
jgi:hypothetical protein